MVNAARTACYVEDRQLARAFLCYAPSEDERPEPFADAVIAVAVNGARKEFNTWLSSVSHPLSELELNAAFAIAIRHAGDDGYRVSRVLHDTFRWKMDMEGVRIVARICEGLPFALRAATRQWAVRTGVRFPAKDKERIGFEMGGEDREGVVISVDQSFAAAIVRPYIGLVPMDPPKRVFAEKVFANVTRGHQAVLSLGDM